MAKTQNTNTNVENQIPLTDAIRTMLSSYSDGQGCPVSLEWARDVEDKTILIDTLPETSTIENDTVTIGVGEQQYQIPVANLVTFALYQGWKDSGYQSYTDLLSLLAAGAVSKLHFNKKSGGGGSVVSKVDLAKQWPELTSIAGIEINKGRLADKDSNTYYLYINATIMDCMKVLEVAKTVPDLEFIGLSPIQNTDKQAIKFKTNRA